MTFSALTECIAHPVHLTHFTKSLKTDYEDHE